MKQKHRRLAERLAVTGWEPGGDGELDRYLVAARLGDGSLKPLGSVKFGLSPAERSRLRAAIAARERATRRRRTAVRWVTPDVFVDVDYHGDGRAGLRDAVLRAVHYPPAD